jgi:hypothetical protein
MVLLSGWVSRPSAKYSVILFTQKATKNTKPIKVTPQE